MSRRRMFDRPESSPESSLSASRRFGMYKDEAAKKALAQNIDNEGLKKLVQAFQTIRTPEGHVDSYYEYVVSSIKNLSYSVYDVEQFAVFLEKLQDEDEFPNRAALFLSALINYGKGMNYVLQLEHLEIPLDSLGYMNTKNITVFGDVSDYLGDRMKSGRIILHGNAGDNAGFEMSGGLILIKRNVDDAAGESMSGGSIVVEESAGNNLGLGMKGGSIRVEGNIFGTLAPDMSYGTITIIGDHIHPTTIAGIGPDMKGGAIHLNGKYGRISHTKEGGEIYHKGKLIG